MRTPLRAVVVAAALAACARTAGPGSVPARVSGSAEPATAEAAARGVPAGGGFKPGGQAAVYYTSTPSRDFAGPPPDPLRDAMLEEVRSAARRAGQVAPAPDPRLDWLMTDIARQVRGNDQPSLEAVDFLLAHYGLPEPTPHILLSQTSTGGESQIRERLRGEIAAMLRAGPSGRVGVGVDRAGGMIYVALGLQERHLELRGPVARVLSMAGYQEIVTHLDSGYSGPALVITAPDGRVSEQTLARRDGAHVGDLRCLARGKHQVEITAVGPGGPGVLANFPVYCGMTPPDRAPGPAGSQPSSGRPEEVEEAVLGLIARDRARAGLAPVVSDPRLAAVARAHSQDMANHDFVSHVSPRTGSTMDRVRVAGLVPELVLENVGRAYSAEEAETGFLSSPGHRGNVLDPRARRVGIGVAFGPPVTGTRPLYVTQLFTN